jgi:3'-5' exoribonuclease
VAEDIGTIMVEGIRAGDEIQSEFILADIRLGQTKNGHAFVGLKLKDRTGSIEARVWDRAEAFGRAFKNGDVAWIRGQAESYQNLVQVKVTEARTVLVETIDWTRFLPCSPCDPEDMAAELARMIEAMSDPHLKGLMRDLLADEALMASLKKAPAAKRFHHAYLGGLMEHTVSVARAALAAADLYPFLNRDLLLAGAIWHDVGKTREFFGGPLNDYTDEGRLLGHLVIGVAMLDEKLARRPDFPPEAALLLRHLIVSHHGEYELGSPKKPKILEALALHQMDDLDAKMNGLGDYIQRHADESGWTDYNRLMERYFYRPTGWSSAPGPLDEDGPEGTAGIPDTSAVSAEPEPPREALFTAPESTAPAGPEQQAEPFSDSKVSPSITPAQPRRSTRSETADCPEPRRNQLSLLGD